VPAVDGALSGGAEDPVLDGVSLEDEPLGWVSPGPVAISPVAPAVEALEVSPEPDASAPLLVCETTSLPAPPLGDWPAAGQACREKPA